MLKLSRITGKQNVHEPYHAVTISILSAAVTSFVEAARYLLQYPGFQFLLSERFTQDPLEAFFCMQRQKGGGSDNPTALQFTYHASSLRIQRSTAPSARSNVRGSKHVREETVDDTPLAKRPRISKSAKINFSVVVLD